MALRADTARHIITAVTVLVFSAAAIGTAMRYQERTGPIQMPSNVEPSAPEAIPASPAAASATPGYAEGSRGSGADIAAKLEGTVALGEATAWPYREGGGRAAAAAATAGSVDWWGKPSASLTPTSGRRSNRAGGSVSGPGGGYTVSGGGREKSANAPNGLNSDERGNSAGAGGSGDSGGSGGGNSAGPGNGSGPVFNNHAPSVGDLVDDRIDGLAGVAAQGVGVDVNPGGLSHTPEPTSLLLMATGLAGVLGAVRRRRRARRG